MKQPALNPFLPSYEYIPDGEPRVFGDRLYLFGSHDAFNGGFYCQNDYVCWSAPLSDLSDWAFEGTIFRYTQDPLHLGAKDHLLQAPDVIQGIDGRYYLYYSMASTDSISVAVCSTPAGAYEFYGHVHDQNGALLGKRPGDYLQFDPALYLENGRVFLYSGICPRDTGFWKSMGLEIPTYAGPMVTELCADMVTVKKEPRVIAPCVKNSKGTAYEGHEFFEAPSLRKRGSRYYFLYSSINGHELCYAVSDFPDRDFQFGGTLVSNADIFLDGRTEAQALNYYGNNHGSIAEVAGQWYVFYHRHTNGNQFSRQACAEKITFREDGKIPQAEITSCGLNPGPLPCQGTFEARIACNLWGKNGAALYGLGDRPMDCTHPYFTQDGGDRESDPNQHIANMTDGAVAGFKFFLPGCPAKITAVTRGSAHGRLLVSDAPDGSPLAVLEISPSVSWSACQGEVRAALTPKAGKNSVALYFAYRGTGSLDFLSFTLS